MKKEQKIKLKRFNNLLFVYDKTYNYLEYLNSLILFSFKKRFFILKKSSFFLLFKLKILPFFEKVVLFQKLCPLFFFNQSHMFLYLKTLAFKCQGYVYAGKWDSDLFYRTLNKKNNWNTNFLWPNLLIVPHAYSSLKIINEMFKRHVVIFGGLLFGKLTYLKLNYFIMGNGLNTQFLFHFCSIISSLISWKNYLFIFYKKNMFAANLLYKKLINVLTTKNKYKLNLLTKRRKRINSSKFRKYLKRKKRLYTKNQNQRFYIPWRIWKKRYLLKQRRIRKRFKSVLKKKRYKNLIVIYRKKNKKIFKKKRRYKQLFKKRLKKLNKFIFLKKKKKIETYTLS